MNSRFSSNKVSWESDSHRCSVVGACPGGTFPALTVGNFTVKIHDRVLLFAAEGFGLGRIKPAPGTWGSLWGLPIGFALAHFDTSWPFRVLVGIAMFVVGVPICSKGAKLRNSKDPGSVVWDEMAAFPIVYAFVPLSGSSLWPTLLAGFVLFRIFDIWKPPPVHHFDRLNGGFGIMIDDTIAALYAAASLYLLCGLYTQ